MLCLKHNPFRKRAMRFLKFLPGLILAVFTAIAIRPSLIPSGLFGVSGAREYVDGFPKQIGAVDETRNLDEIVFSPDGTRVAYSYFMWHGEKSPAYVDGIVVAKSLPNETLSRLYFSPDSEEFMVVIGSRVGDDFAPYDIEPFRSQLYLKLRNSEKISISSPLEPNEMFYDNDSTFSRDLFLVDPDRKTVKDRERHVLGRSESGGLVARFDLQKGCTSMDFCESEGQIIIESPDVGKIIHPLLVDSKNFPTKVTFSSDGKRIAYTTGTFVVVTDADGKGAYLSEGEKYDRISAASLRFSPDGSSISYGAMRGKKLYWVVEKI